MTFKKTLFMGLLGCTILAGCNGSDNAADNTTADSTFDTAVAGLNTTIDQLKQGAAADAKANQDKFAQLNTVIAGSAATIDELKTKLDTQGASSAATIGELKTKLDTQGASSAAAIDELKTTIGTLQEAISALQERPGLSEAELAALRALNLEQMQTDLRDVQERLDKVEGDQVTLLQLNASVEKLQDQVEVLEARPQISKEDIARIGTLATDVTALQKDLKEAIETAATDRIALKAADGTIAQLRLDLTTSTIDPVTITTLNEKIAKLEEKLGTLSTASDKTIADFKTRIATLEAELEALKNPPRVDIPGLTQFVNTFIGTENADIASGSVHSGNNNPGAQTPFGMVSFSPDNAGTGPYGRGVNGYAYRETDIQFFSMTHLNGPGCRGQGAVPIMPRIALDKAPQKFKTKDGVHTQEMATPGYYKVTTTDEITSELTATTRTGMARFTYPADKVATLIIDARKSNNVKTEIDAAEAKNVSAVLDIAGKSVSGQTNVGPFCNTNWKQPVYFYAQFDQPLKAESNVTSGAIANLTFDLTGTNRTVQMKTGISSVSVANAKLNLEAENPGWAFDGPDGIKTKADKDWNTRLNTIQLDLAKPGSIDAITDTTKKAKALQYVTQFYSALYRTMGGPTVYSDVNGDYRSMDQRANLAFPTGGLPERKKENVSAYKFKIDGKDAGYKTHYSGFSMWDTYRSLAQFQALLFPDEASDMMQSLVADAQQCGAFPHWVDGSEDTTPMNGDHAPTVIAGSYAFGARKFDLETARKYMKQSGFGPANQCNDKANPGSADIQKDIAFFAKDIGGSFAIELVTTDNSIGAFLNALPGSAEADKSDITKLFTRASNWKISLTTQSCVPETAMETLWMAVFTRERNLNTSGLWRMT